MFELQDLQNMTNEKLLNLYAAWVRKWHYEPYGEIILPHSLETVEKEILSRMSTVKIGLSPWRY